ncbi:MAG: glycosyltransferase [Planctomycetes bacterium]|nr:glycosyltransferase [Planctomycetota bacterium]
MIALSITAWVLLAVCAAAVAIWIVLLVRINMMLVDRPTVRDGIDLPAPPDGWPSLSIIVPAHDEQDMIDGCATLLREQEYENLQIVFVLDRCTDNTAAVLARHARADPRIVVIENESCPEDWAGKCNAARIGAEHATGDWLLFTDADTRFDPQLARAAVALARERDLALLSLLSTLTVEHRFERIAQVAATMTLLELYPIHRTDRTKSPRPFANGQFMLFRRDWYDRIGGHDAVKDALLEDIAAAKLIARHGGRGSVLFADGMLMCSMYDSPAAFDAGWRRVFIEACARRPARLRKWSRRTLAFGAAMPVLQVAALITAAGLASAGDPPLAIAMAATVLVGWAAQTAVLLRVYALARAPLRTILLYPLGCLIVGRILARAARDLELGRPIVWGRKEYVLEPRG